MGKSYKDMMGSWTGGQSVDYHSQHSRKIIGNKKAHSHRRVRAHNRIFDEDNFEKFDCKVEDKMYYKTEGKSNKSNGNIPNMKERLVDDSLSNETGYIIKYEIKNNNFTEQLNDKIVFLENTKTKNHHMNRDLRHLKATLKQLDRRGCIGPFLGHR